MLRWIPWLQRKLSVFCTAVLLQALPIYWTGTFIKRGFRGVVVEPITNRPIKRWFPVLELRPRQQGPPPLSEVLHPPLLVEPRRRGASSCRRRGPFSDVVKVTGRLPGSEGTVQRPTQLGINARAKAADGLPVGSIRLWRERRRSAICLMGGRFGTIILAVR